MAKITIDDYVVKLKCPFCGTDILRTYDHSILTDDLSDEEYEEVIGDSFDLIDGECEHLAIRSDCGFSDPQIIGSWEPEVMILAKAVYDNPEADVETVLNAIHPTTNMNLTPIAKKALPDFDFSASCISVEKFGGPRSWGVTFIHVFLKKKSQLSGASNET